MNHFVLPQPAVAIHMAPDEQPLHGSVPSVVSASALALIPLAIAVPYGPQTIANTPWMWQDMHQALQLKLQRACTFRRRLGSEFSLSLGVYPVTLGLGILMGFAQAFTGSYEEADTTGEPNRRTHTTLRRFASVRRFCAFESIGGAGYWFGNMRVGGNGSIRFIAPPIQITFIDGRASHFGRKDVVALYSVWEVRAGANVVTVENGSGNLLYDPALLAEIVSAVKLCVREWPTVHAQKVHHLIRAWALLPY